MKISTDWVSPPTSIGGLDHLGTQAPCVLIYGQLLPGITNVTDRARYYSFYPWLIWSFDQRHLKDETKFIEFFRRADCLFTLISERHARVTDHDNERHGAAMVGRVQLLQALDRLEAGAPLKLSDYTSQESAHRYFKNPMGGLGQYYAGALADLKLMDSSAKPWIKYTKEYGATLAEQVNSTTPADRFWQVVESDDVRIDDLDALDAYCACRLAKSLGECQTLTDLYFDRNNAYEQEGAQRRRSLGLILNLTRSLLVDGHDLKESVFRACTYSGTLPGGHHWTVPEPLQATLACWAIYQRNDLLSIACQTVLGTVLRELEPQYAAERITYGSVESYAEAFSNGEIVAAVAKIFNAESFGSLLDRLDGTAPSIGYWESDEHEIQVAARMMECWGRGGDAKTLIELSLTVLALLACRDDLSQTPYGGIAMPPEALTNYPINLASFRSRVATWRAMPIPAVFADLVMWCLNTHLRVALRKLNQTGRSTFHLRPSERGLEVVGEIPPPANTTPRFVQAVQILRDIGALTRDLSKPNRQTTVSGVGVKLMEEASV